MKRILSLVFLISTLAMGCALNYDMTLNNGDVIRAANKPRLNDRGDYIFKDAAGREHRINRLRVLQIEAVSPGEPLSGPTKSFR